MFEKQYRIRIIYCGINNPLASRGNAGYLTFNPGTPINTIHLSENEMVPLTPPHGRRINISILLPSVISFAR